MTLYEERGRFRKLSLAAGRIFSRIPLSPNSWTLLALAVAVAGFALIFCGDVLAGAVIFALASFVDIIDGAVARATKSETPFGAYLDTVTDKYIEFITIASLLLLNLPYFILPAYAWAMLLAFGCLVTSFAKAASAEKNIVPHREGHGAGGSILDHTDRQLILILAIALSVFYPVISIYIIVALAVLTNISSVQRIMNARSIWLGKKR